MTRSGRCPERWLGLQMLDAGGHAFGVVADVLLDARSAVPEWVVVRFRGLRPAVRAVPVSLLVDLQEQVMLQVSGSVVRRSPRVPAGRPVTGDRELALTSYWRPFRLAATSITPGPTR